MLRSMLSSFSSNPGAYVTHNAAQSRKTQVILAAAANMSSSRDEEQLQTSDQLSSFWLHTNRFLRLDSGDNTRGLTFRAGAVSSLSFMSGKLAD